MFYTNSNILTYEPPDRQVNDVTSENGQFNPATLKVITFPRRNHMKAP